MKKVLVACLFFAATSAVIGQNIAETWNRLQLLEGSWYLNDRRQAVFSIWQKTPDGALENRTLTLICGDTVELSHSRIELTSDGQLRLDLFADSLQLSAPMQFRLANADPFEPIFQNLNPAAGHARVGWNFFGQNYFALTVNELGTDKTFDYRRFYERVTRLDLRLRAGANLASLSTQGILYGRQEFAARPGFEFGLGTTFRSLEGPLAIGLEIGLLRRQIHVKSELPYNGGVFRNGNYQRTDFYFALMPEVAVGEAHEWAVSGGVYLTAVFQRNFDGSVRTYGDANPGGWFAKPNRDLDSDWGFAAGISRRIGGKKWEKAQPALYLRAWLGNNNLDNLYGGEGSLRMRGISIGLSTRLRSL
jgi:hypothetical protein